MNDDVSVLDEYARIRADNPLFNPELIDANSGHRLLCPRCKAFRRMRIEVAHLDDGHDVLRVICKTCADAVDFVLREDGRSFVPAPFAKLVYAFTKRQAREYLLREAAGAVTDDTR